MGLWMLFGLLVVAVVLGLAIYLGVRAGHRPDERRSDREDARAQLDRRFAAGEIDTDEYHERASALRSM